MDVIPIVVVPIPTAQPDNRLDRCFGACRQVQRDIAAIGFDTALSGIGGIEFDSDIVAGRFCFDMIAACRTSTASIVASYFKRIIFFAIV